MPRSKNRRKRIKPRTVGRRPRIPTSLFRQSGQTWVRLGGWQEQLTDGSGEIAGVLPSDPTLINNGTAHPEYAAWSSLYSEIRVVSMVVNFFPRFSESKSVITDGTPLAIAGSTNNTLTPTSIDTVLDNASSRAWNFLNDTSPRGFRFEFMYPSLLYAASASPGGITATGTPGGIGYYGSGYAASSPGIFIRYSVVYQMRNRL